jgi:hypothetical protein
MKHQNAAGVANVLIGAMLVSLLWVLTRYLMALGSGVSEAMSAR